MYLLCFVLSFTLFLYSTLKEGIIISSAMLYPVTVMAANPQPKQVSDCNFKNGTFFALSPCTVYLLSLYSHSPSFALRFIASYTNMCLN